MKQSGAVETHRFKQCLGEENQMLNEHLKRYSSSLIIKEMKLAQQYEVPIFWGYQIGNSKK
jgi:hypothetical protein